ncbi:flagellar biosynthesis protein FlgN [Psychromarinibacter sp. C21-152]|uniref:Flagellar biosynthesis protein FlgN n=1 Tax=Psychromarinibacter sediminicola TaxID=3033385 RepID=A0AAE3NT34_9RHOB|nr:flagellar biosynthesis protein FlgN [Psychromarinibacter sediminicola]MDF0601939.1 flagellar biosynthesis protein FlgN [Psychromarinibacter sediminicola]
MALFEFRDAAGALHDLLDREREAILAGRFDVLERLAPEKERLGTRLARGASGGGELECLRRKAERNGRLLAAAQSGLTDAQARLEALRRPDTLHTYDASGCKKVLDGAARPTNRRR